MNNFNLKYFKDMDGNYILKRKISNEDETEYIQQQGDSSFNLVLSTHNFEKKLQHRLDETIIEVEDYIRTKNKIFDKDIIFEKIIAEVQDEQEFNPLIQNMSQKEIDIYTKHSKKVRVNINFEFHFKPKNYFLPKLFFKKIKL